MNLCELGLFHIVSGVSKGTHGIIMRFGESNVLGSKYIDIYKFRGLAWGDHMVHLSFFVYYSWKMEKVQEHDVY